MTGSGAMATAAGTTTTTAKPLPAESLLRPSRWPASCGAVMSTRQGGEGVAPFDTLNLRAHPEDPVDVATVDRHVARLVATVGAVPVWLRQVHGPDVVRLTAADRDPSRPTLVADASITTERGLACTVQVADCLPVLLADRAGRVVGAAHAGWRPLAAGVVENTVAAMQDAVPGLAPADLVCWLGACIGPERFEVGDDVQEGFVAAMGEAALAHFRPSPPKDGARKWLADLRGLATERLRALGVEDIEASTDCTVSDASRFFSFRRDRYTGRMAALAWIRADGR